MNSVYLDGHGGAISHDELTEPARAFLDQGKAADFDPNQLWGYGPGYDSRDDWR